jgi:subtilase family serine protease
MRYSKQALASYVALFLLCMQSASSQNSPTRPGFGAATAAQVYARFDKGELPPDTKLRRMRVVLANDIFKNNALQTLLFEQQDKHSSNYHQWISAKEYGKRFGAGTDTVSAVSQWLVNSGMSDVQTSKGNTYISFSGSVAAVEQAMHPGLHSYRVAGETHYANTKAPFIPKSLRGLVTVIQGLDDFVPRPSPHPALKAQYVTGSGLQSIGPGDLAAIYDISPLYRAGISGSRSTLAVVGAATPSLDDFQAYKQLFGLPANDFSTVIVPGSAAGTSAGGAEIEAALDLEVAGAIAPKAKLVYVQDDDIFGAVAYVVDNNLADILSMSYTVCELPGPEDMAYETLAMQATAEGITWVNASGDSGAAACEQAGSNAATSGLSVNLPASLPEVTGVGGTAFTNTSSSQYWASTNSSVEGTALGYVPEMVWNGSVNGLNVTASGGGISKDFYKPGFQSSIEDGQLYREVPDISFDASQAKPPYLIVTGGQVYYVGGTSAAAPLFAAIAALVNDYQLSNGGAQQSGLGNVNLQLYRMAQTDPDAFHDVTTGNNKVSCAEGSVDCIDGSIGYDAGIGYDMATGLGSVDAYKLATDWNSVELSSSTVNLVSGNADSSGSVTLTATVTANSSPAPGVVVFSWTNAAYQNVPTEFARVVVGNDGVAQTTFAGLPSGANLVTAAFQGTTDLLGSLSPAVTVNVAAAGAPTATASILDVQPQVSALNYLPLSATITGTSAAPTGVVNFYLGTTLMGSASVINGVAMTLSSTLPAVGIATLIAHYSGDSNYAAVVSEPVSITVVAPTTASPPAAPLPDFTLSAPSTVTMTQGTSGSIPVIITPLKGFAAAIQFACSGPVSGYSCTAPASVTPKGSMTVTATLAAQVAALLPFAAILFLRKRRQCFALASALLLTLCGCGYHVNKTSALASEATDDAGSYTVTITATSGTLVHTAVVKVIVQ